MRLTLLVALCLFAAPTGAEGWICFAEKAVGFVYNGKPGAWEARIFQTKSKYVIRRPGKQDGPLEGVAKWVVSESGVQLPIAVCTREIDESLQGGWLDCAASGEFTFHKGSMKFVRKESLMYFATPDKLKAEAPVTVYMQVGDCSPL